MLSSLTHLKEVRLQCFEAKKFFLCNFLAKNRDKIVTLFKKYDVKLISRMYN